jgi:peptide/nickel transport system substrate-binding protein
MLKAWSNKGVAMHRRTVLQALGFAALMVSTPPCSLEAEPVRGGTLRFLVEQEPTTLVTIAHTAGASTRISPKVTEGLLTYGFDFKPKPALAAEWSASPDGLTYSFKLRPGVKWHDGKDFTAADVAYSIDLLKKFRADAPPSPP